MKCGYCNHKHVKIEVIHIYMYIKCSRCENVLHKPPYYIPEEQHFKYLEKYLEKYLKCK